MDGQGVVMQRMPLFFSAENTPEGLLMAWPTQASEITRVSTLAVLLFKATNLPPASARPGVNDCSKASRSSTDQRKALASRVATWQSFCKVPLAQRVSARFTALTK